MFFNRWGGTPEVVEGAMRKLIVKELGLAPSQIEAQRHKLRDTLHFSETFFAPLNDTPSHVYDFAYDAGRPTSLRVSIDGDRDSPLGLTFSAPTRYQPTRPIVYRRAVLRFHFSEGEPQQLEQLQQRPQLMKLLKRCANASYANIHSPNASVTVIPEADAGRVIALCMPKDRWGFAAFDELGCDAFRRLVDGLDRLGDSPG